MFLKVHKFGSSRAAGYTGDFTNQNATQPETSPEVICACLALTCNASSSRSEHEVGTCSVSRKRE